MKTIFAIVLSVMGGVVGAYLFTAGSHLPTFGATVARTTITNPWTFASTTIFSATPTVTTTNTATSTLVVGCIQTYATSTASPVYIAFGASNFGTTTFGAAGRGLVTWQFGSCPK